MNNTLSTQATVNYYWNFTIHKWNGTQWINAGISGSSTPVAGYSIPALTTVDLPYYVYLLNSSTVKWGDWLKINFTFHWTYSGNSYSSNYVAELNVHLGDISGAATVTFPYLGADGDCNLLDVVPIAKYWQKKVPLGTDPTSMLARADINGDGVVNLNDVTPIALSWLKTWSTSKTSLTSHSTG
jgi:hypothetical protein